MKPVHTSLLAPFAAAPGHFQAMANPQERLLYSSGHADKSTKRCDAGVGIRRRLPVTLLHQRSYSPSIGRLRNTPAQSSPAALGPFAEQNLGAEVRAALKSGANVSVVRNPAPRCRCVRGAQRDVQSADSQTTARSAMRINAFGVARRRPPAGAAVPRTEFGLPHPFLNCWLELSRPTALATVAPVLAGAFGHSSWVS